MQQEHVIYALSGLAVEAAEQGLPDFAQSLIEMCLNEEVPKRLATLMSEADEDELVLFLIEERMKEERRG